MTDLDQLLMLLVKTLPDVSVVLDRHSGPGDKAAWVQLAAPDNSRTLDVEYRPGDGFGLHHGEDEAPFGGPQEICTTPAQTVARVAELLGAGTE
jgi:hypothetical protein